MSKTRSLHHIVFATKHRQNTIREEHKREMYLYLMRVLEEKKCFLHRLNGMPDHIHMLIDLHPSVALADLVKHLKIASTLRFKGHPNFPKFNGWGVGYYAFSLSPNELATCKNYIINQENHHKDKSLTDEMEFMAELNALQWHKDDLE